MNESHNEYVDALVRKVESLQDDIKEKKAHVRDLLETIQEKEQQIDYILKLLATEGVTLNNGAVDSTTQMSVADMAFEVLTRHNSPMHYKDLADSILAEGKLIPGQDPAANLIAHLTRDTRFIRTGRGVYALVAWGITAHPVLKRKRRKRRQLR